jgi:hypothetical protein
VHGEVLGERGQERVVGQQPAGAVQEQQVRAAAALADAECGR